MLLRLSHKLFLFFKFHRKIPKPFSLGIFLFPELATAGANSTTNAYVSAAADGRPRPFNYTPTLTFNKILKVSVGV